MLSWVCCGNGCRRIDSTDKIASAVRYENPKGRSWFRKAIGKKIYIEPEALTYLKSLNGYDQDKVIKGVEELASIPHPSGGMVNTLRPNFFKAKTVHYFTLKYQVTSELVVVSDIDLNASMLSEKPKGKGERGSLHRVQKVGNMQFTATSALSDSKALQEQTWSRRTATHDVQTEHAAVNGMLNELQKATWLMGVHAEHAYPEDKVSDYTLFHNPSEGGALDFYESARDNMGLTTEVSRHLAAVLADVQRKGKPVKWVVHSQGGIIFKQAVKLHLKNYPGSSLDKNTVVFHAGGNNKKEASRILTKAGIKRAAPDKDNPFDLVPNLAGRNHMDLASIKRSVSFWTKVKGTPDASPVESPHTLPFISLEAYHRFLTLAGDERSAAKVKKHMQTMQGQGH
ncbi:type II toxin-antitoxin system RelE family toxin [Endozoicomonas numazuensis]|uniref:Uncharacterized protein n=1 Tax=Endozoicomonas numazuensis TaxID=1137799 RepID=A0A081NLN8_9GAMM|nr:hypothetical protein [Endozoicomonas numazuensis]KEQ19361.1 hypothetical protein GZ78_05200 [Endozoicomonas numazuensis]